jgi:hypothetical protein
MIKESKRFLLKGENQILVGDIGLSYSLKGQKYVSGLKLGWSRYLYLIRVNKMQNI